MDFATYKTAISTWVEAQSGLTCQWRDEAGGWQGKPRVRAHLRSSRALGVDYLVWDHDTDLSATPPYTVENPFTSDYVPTVQGNRQLTLTLKCESRNQSGNNTAIYYLEKLRSSLQKPSTRSTLYAAGLVVTSAEQVIDLAKVLDDRIESVATLDLQMAAAINDRDEDEADSYADNVTVSADLTKPDTTSGGWSEESMP